MNLSTDCTSGAIALALSSPSVLCVVAAEADAFIMNYADKIPERWHEHREVLITEALAQAWPCRR
jgi:hypothetical protein